MQFERILLKRCFIKRKRQVTAHKDAKKKGSEISKSTKHFPKVEYTLEMQPPLIHLNDPTEFILHIIGSHGTLFERVKFTDHVAESQSSVAQIEQINVGNIQYLKIIPNVENILSRYNMEKLIVTRTLEGREIYNLLKKPQFSSLIPPKLKNYSVKDRSLLSHNDSNGSENKESLNLSLPLADKYVFGVLAHENLEPPISYHLEFSNVAVDSINT
uniref:Uncharacterized protein n=2 Tax=Trichobilharzia regenti TaxID=157069 RepID=A0AA85KBG8_TRIRE|nr:unnamed protein product [Trichobilharzia regenti]